MRTLITGFGPFPGVRNNLSAVIAKRLCAEISSTDTDLLILDTDWKTAPQQVVNHLEQAPPLAIIHLGVSERAKDLSLEIVAYNETCDTPDVTGACCADIQLAPGCPLQIGTTAPIAQIKTYLRAGNVPFTCSKDPGRYLCNAVYYTSLRYVTDGTGRSAPCIFAHIPVACATGTIQEPEIITGLSIIHTALISD